MSLSKGIALVLVGFVAFGAANAAVTSTFNFGSMTDGSDLPYQPAANDLIAGIAPPIVNAYRPGTTDGFHPANTAPADQFPAYTDSVFGGGLSGLLADNDPVVDGQVIQDITYTLNGDTVTELRVFGGNSDARQFLTLIVELSYDGTTFVGVGANNGYFQPAGVNTNDTPQGFGTVMRIFDDSGAPLGTGVQAIRLQFFASGNNNPQRYVDPFDGVNPYTGFDDGQFSANQSPLIREVDVLPEPTSLLLLGLAGMLIRRR